MLDQQSIKCQRCDSDRIVAVGGKLMAIYSGYGYQKEIPGHLNIGSSNAILFEYCKNCGQIQGNFPEEINKLELI